MQKYLREFSISERDKFNNVCLLSFAKIKPSKISCPSPYEFEG